MSTEKEQLDKLKSFLKKEYPHSRGIKDHVSWTIELIKELEKDSERLAKIEDFLSNMPFDIDDMLDEDEKEKSDEDNINGN